MISKVEIIFTFYYIMTETFDYEILGKTRNLVGITSPKSKFFHFGCWNEGGCKNNPNLEKVVQNIKKEADSFAFGIIAGDNVYPNKHRITQLERKTNKTPEEEIELQEIKQNPGHHRLDIFNDGKDCVKKIGVPLYVILGNHDVTQCDIVKAHIADNSSEWNFPSNYYNVEWSVGNKRINLIFIDTNLLSSATAVCYSKDRNVNWSLERKKMLDWVKGNIRAEYDHYIVVGHDPIVSCKAKGGATKMLFIDKVDDFIECLSGKKVYYLCADTHNYQHIKITNDKFGTNKVDIEVIVAGTGGAHPDGVPDDYKERCTPKTIQNCSSIDSGQCKLTIAEMNKSYGYCEVTVGDTLEFKYIQVADYITDTQHGGEEDLYKAKYLKYKSKYLALKKGCY